MKIPKELDYLLSTQKRKDAKERIKKTYQALLYKKGKQKGYFSCPSAYLEKASSRYYKAIALMLEHGIIEYQSFNIEQTDLFESRRKKYYNTENGTCMRYRFLIDTEEGREEEVDVDFSSLYDGEKWFMKTRYSLLQLGFPIDGLMIKRDNFSRRLHTNITGNIGDGMSYKDLLSGGEYYSIDAKTCHPRLIWLMLKSMHQEDQNLSYVFDNDIDFYDYILENAPSIARKDREAIQAMRESGAEISEEHVRKTERSAAKEAFMSWINGTGYMDEDVRPLTRLFPIANAYVRGFKSNSYKDMARMLQYRESKIFIDELLSDIPIEFCLTVHDSLIVRKEDADKALRFCQERHPEMKFSMSAIER